MRSNTLSLRPTGSAARAGDRVEAVRPGVAGDRAVPGVAHAVRAREEVVDREVLGRVVAHRQRAPLLGRLLLADEVLDEPAVAVRELLGDRGRPVLGVEALVERLPRPVERGLAGPERKHRDPLPAVVLVPLVAVQPVHVRQPVALQVAEHVVERSVLHHQDDDVVDLPQVRESSVRAQRRRAGSSFGSAGSRGTHCRTFPIQGLLIEDVPVSRNTPDQTSPRCRIVQRTAFT